MSEFFDHVEAQLRHAAGRGAHLPWHRRLRRRAMSAPRRPAALVLVGAGLVALPAAAQVAGVWDSTPAEPAPEAGIVAEPGEPLVDGAAAPRPEDENVVIGESCTVPAGPPPPASPRPPKRAILESLAVLRRPRHAGDTLPPRFAGRPGVAGINRHHVRLARRTPSGGRYYLIPAENIRHAPGVADRPGCPGFDGRRPAPLAGVCLHVVGDAGGGTCLPISLIRRGHSLLTADRVPGTKPGTVSVASVVPDGVERVTLRYPARAPVREVSGPVVGNVFAATFNGSAAVLPRVLWHMADGEVREVRRPRR